MHTLAKHYGGRVPAMGFALVYLMPAFYTDTTEGFVKGTATNDSSSPCRESGPN